MIRKSSLFLFLTCIMTSLFSPLAFGDVKSVPTSLSQEQIKQEIALIDARIQKLQSKKEALDARAQAAGKDADRLHFQDFTTSRMFSKRQEHFQAMSHGVEIEIEALKQKKEELQKLVK